MHDQNALVRLVTLCAATLLGAACSGSDSAGVSTPPAPPVEQLVVSVSPERDTLLLGTSKLFTARVTNAAGLARSVPVDWTTLDPSIATISQGNVTAVGAGEARLVARAGSAADTAFVVVTMPQVELRVTPSAVSATLGDTIEFQATIVGPSGAATQTTDIVWSISDSAAAQLVGNGTLMTRAEGELQVTAKIGTITATAAVKIDLAPVYSVAIVPSNVSLAVGGRQQLVAELRDSKGRLLTGRTVKWETSASSTATVSDKGGVTAIAKGGAIITASSEGKSATAAVNVSSTPATSVVLTLPNDSLGTGRNMQAAATPLDATGKPIVGRPLAWQSSNPSVATINNTGLIVALISGQTTISVIVDGKVASERLTTVVPAPRSLVVVPGTALLVAGSTSKLTAEVRDQFGILLSGQNVVWSSTAPAVASVDAGGTVSGLSLGSASVKAASGTLIGTSALTVQNIPVASVSLSPTSVSIEVGETTTLTVTALDAAGNVLTNRPVSWISSSASVATVSATGLVSGTAAGSASVTATVEGKAATSGVTVNPPAPTPVASITITFNSSVLSINQSTTAKARTYDGQGTELIGRQVTFASADPTLATVSADGNVIARSAGTVTIAASSEGQTGYAALTIQASAPAPVATVSLSAPTTSLVVGDSTRLVVVLRDSTGTVLTGRTVSFNSPNSGVASVSTTGLVRAMGAGTSTLSATSEGRSAILAFTMTKVKAPPPAPAPVATVSVTLNSSSVAAGQGTQGNVVLLDSASNVLSGRVVAWSSSNTAVATVTQAGYVSGVAAGSATISAQSEGKSGSALLAVLAQTAVVTSVQVTLNPATIVVGGASLATAVARDSAGATISGRAVTWSVAVGSTVASVSSSTTSTNSVTGKSAGSASIVAIVDGVTSSAALTVNAAPPPPPPPPSTVTLPALPTLINFTYPTVTGKSWVVKAGDPLQTILNQAQRGDEVVIQAGATFKGNFTLPAKTGNASNGWILVRSDMSARLPAQGTRITPASAPLMPKLESDDTGAALQTAASASGWWVSGIELTLNPALTANYGLVLLGDATAAQNSLSLVPSDIVLDRVYVHASPTTPTSRCVALNSARTAVQDSYLFDCHLKGFDSQAIAGWNGPGPFKIVNNTLAGAGENIMFGGADPKIANLTPSDIEIRNNYIYTPISWMTTWTKKNLLELKHAQRVLIEGNVLDGSWADAQVGYAMLFKSANQGGNCNWCATRDVTVRYNIIQNAGAGFNLTGREGNNPYPVGELLNRVLIEQNILRDIDTGPYTGDSKYFQLLQNLSNLTIRSNTMTSPAQVTQFLSIGPSPAATNFDYQNNITTYGRYGLFSSATGSGEAALGNIKGVVTFKNVVIIGALKPGYPNARFVPDANAAAATGLGANAAAVNSATAGVIIP